MKYAILILALVGFISWGPARGQDSSRNSDNYRRDRSDYRNGGDYRDRNSDRRDFRRFDRNGGQDSRYDRSRSDRSYDRPRESVTVSTVTPVSAPAQPKPAIEIKTVVESEPEYVENVSTNNGPIDPRSYDAFRIIAIRNIFDPNRYPGSNTRPTGPSAPPKRTELFTLVGAMSYEKGDFAFFDSNSSEYRKTVKPGDTIAGYKVAAVGADKVTLEAEGKKVELPVGGQMKRYGDEEWKVNSRTEPMGSTGSSASSSTSATNSDGSSTSSSSGDMPEALKRLLEQRKNEK